MDRGAWWSTVRGGRKEADVTAWRHAQTVENRMWQSALWTLLVRDDGDQVQGHVSIIPWCQGCSANAGGLSGEGRWLTGGWRGPDGGSTPHGSTETLAAEKLRLFSFCSWVTSRGHFSLFCGSFILMRLSSPLSLSAILVNLCLHFLTLFEATFFWVEDKNAVYVKRGINFFTSPSNIPLLPLGIGARKINSTQKWLLFKIKACKAVCLDFITS